MRCFALALAAAVAALPAHAADLGTIECVSGGISPALREQIEKDVTRNLSESGKRPTYDASVGQGLSNAAKTCATQHKWSEAATRAAGVYALAKLGKDIADRAVTERGFDPATLEDQFQTLAEDTRNRPLAAADMQALVIASVPEEAKQTRENAELLNEYFMFLSTLQYAAWDFSQA
jgi:hypothetical protein